MSGRTLRGSPQQAGTLDAKSARQHLREAPLRGDQLIAFGRSSRRAGWIVGGIGAAFGAAGLTAAVLAMALYKPQPPEFALIDRNTGEVSKPIRAVDAPVHFTDATVKQYLRLFVENCESYRFETRELLARRCSIMLSPAQQTRYAAENAASKATSPQARLGRQGEARIKSNSLIYTPIGTGQGGVQFWTIRFVKIESEGPNRATVCRPWIENVQFQWLPQLEMAPEDRDVNTAGFQAITFDSQPDPNRVPEGC